MAARFRSPTAAEARRLAQLILEVNDWRGTAAGALYRRTFEDSGITRNEYERWVDALVKVGLLFSVEESFEKDGQTIRYRRLVRNPKSSASLNDVRLPEAIPCNTRSRATSSKPSKGRRPNAKDTKRAKKTRKSKEGRHTKGKGKAANKPDPASLEAMANAAVVERLRSWRLSQARLKRIPAFRIMTDRTLFAIATTLPESKDALLRVHGVGPKLADKYGTKILSLIRI
ncbi:MAG: hypothetical protein CSA75_00660 [Sorangium cellulosum]|nr:MAG: hypothetical protein CSA75_00660 [Sorangium cellulosum]